MSAANPEVRKPWPLSPLELHEAIGRRAEEIYQRNGNIPGHDMENWVQAEADILRESARYLNRTAVVVKIKGVQYVGEYESGSSAGYVPGEFIAGASVPVRFDGDKMFVKRPNGKELETTIVQKVG